jgi:nanoRNase/pAp phosphatase (c-di-AMP/oligoRNAs hydrolase)
VTTEQVGTEEEWARAVKALDGATEICLACHVRPDGDALGSMLAVTHALRARSRPPGSAPVSIVASFGDRPFEIPRILRFLPGAELLSPPDAFPERPQVMVTFDAASPVRAARGERSGGRRADRPRPSRVQHRVRHREPDRRRRRRHRGARV